MPGIGEVLRLLPESKRDSVLNVMHDLQDSTTPVTPEITAMIADATTIQAKIQLDLAEFTDAATTLPGEIVNREAQEIELACQKANAEFFNNLTS